MKLFYYTYRKISCLLLLLMACWGVLFYYTILNEVMEETDDALENFSHLLIKQALDDPSVLETARGGVSFYEFRPISEEEGVNYKEEFYDSFLYVATEDEDQPVRVMRTAFRMPDGQFYELELMISTLERDDMVETMLGYLGALFLLFLIATSLGIRAVLKGSFRPLHRLLEWLHRLQPGEEVPPLDNPTRIREFRELSAAAVDMGNRSYRAYEAQKQFIENASHELQTPLAIVRNKVELLAESESLTAQQMKELEAIYATLERAVRLNNSLLLLSRIENGQYAGQEEVSMDELADQLLPDLLDIYEHKHVQLYREQQKGAFIVRCNRMLAQILLSNLLKNSLLHNLDQGELYLLTTPSSLEIRNSGDAPLDGEKLFTRFYHGASGKKNSTGLGLAIARSIAQASALQLTYRWEQGMHCFRLSAFS